MEKENKSCLNCFYYQHDYHNCQGQKDNKPCHEWIEDFRVAPMEQLVRDQINKLHLDTCQNCDCFQNYICTAGKDWETCEDKIETISIFKEVE